MKDFKLLEHNLIPCSLFVLNISVVHLIYLLFINNTQSLITLLAFSCTIFLIAGVVMKKKYLMIFPAITYMLLLFLAL